MKISLSTVSNDLSLHADDEMMEHIHAQIQYHLSPLGLGFSEERTAKEKLGNQLAEWSEAMSLGDMPVPKNAQEWSAAIAAQMDAFQQTLAGAIIQDEQKFQAHLQTRSQDGVGKDQQNVLIAQEMDRTAAENGLPVLIPYDDETLEPDEEDADLLYGASQDKEPKAVRLEGKALLATTGLSNCTAVSLYDPQTQVGAMMHINRKKVDFMVAQALLNMQVIDKSVDPSRIQATIMPGGTSGVAGGHSNEFNATLAKYGISKIRDFKQEGRGAESLILHPGGAISARSLYGPPALPKPDHHNTRQDMESPPSSPRQIRINSTGATLSGRLGQPPPSGASLHV